MKINNIVKETISFYIDSKFIQIVAVVLYKIIKCGKVANKCGKTTTHSDITISCPTNRTSFQLFIYILRDGDT